MGAVPVAAMDFSKLRQGMRVRVTRVAGESPHLERLQEMGLIVGTVFQVVKVAPLGDPVEIDLRGYRLCLRRAESSGIEVEPVE
jgi:ferrous iron transport protein A